MPSLTSQKRPISYLLRYMLVITIVFGIQFANAIWRYPSDWSAHIQFIVDYISSGKSAVVHVTFHVLVLLLGQILGLHVAALIVGIVATNLTWLLLYRALGQIPYLKSSQAALGALALLVAAPITLLTMNTWNLYFGYLSFQAMHSPTLVVLKPLALLLFGYVVLIARQEIKLNRVRAITIILLCLVSTFAKPNFALVLLPTLGVMALWHLARFKRHFNREFLAWTLLIAATLTGTLVMQYIVQYSVIDNSEGSIVIAPLAEIQIYEPSVVWLAIKFIMSIAFPLLVTIFYRTHLRTAVALQIAWLIFTFGALQVYLLTETGARAGSGNFYWGAQLGLFILFLVAFESMLRYRHQVARWKYRISMAVFALHVISGVIFSVLTLFASTQYEFW